MKEPQLYLVIKGRLVVRLIEIRNGKYSCQPVNDDKCVPHSYFPEELKVYTGSKLPTFKNESERPKAD